MSSNPQPNPAQPCETIQDLIPAYAFGLTTADEARLVETHLSACPEAAAQLTDYRRMQDNLRAAVPQVEPPPGLEDRLMAAVAAAEQPSRRRPQIHRAWWVAAAALVALVVSNVFWLTRSSSPPPVRTSESNSVPVLVQGDSSFVLTSSREIRWVRLPPSKQYADASAVLMWNVESEIGLLYVRGFPRPAVGRTFQLWLTRGEEKLNAGTFQVDETGSGALLFDVTEAIDKYTWARITEEPENGSTQPGDSVVVVGEL